MTEKTYNVGDVVEWMDVPPGAMVQERDECGVVSFCVRMQDGGCMIYDAGITLNTAPKWRWGTAVDAFPVTIIALGLTGQETAADLQRLAEVFEVREAWLALPPHTVAPIESLVVAYADAGTSGNFDGFYRRLHAAGWRPGDTAERASELLRGAP
jgi:hypothetical protein